MKQEYRRMIEQVSLDDGEKAAMLEAIQAKPASKRPARALRTAVIAACVCLALAGMAFAADSLGLFGQTTTIEQKDDGNYMAENVQCLRLYPMDQFSPALQADWERLDSALNSEPVLNTNQYPDGEIRPDGGISRYFDSWQDALDYVGIPLEENALLDGRELFAPLWQGEEIHPFWGLQVRVYPGAVLVWRSYELDGVALEVRCTILTEAYNGSNSGGGVQGEVEVHDDGTATVEYLYDRSEGLFDTLDLTRAETRTTADGGEVLFVSWSGTTDFDWYEARFVHGGVDYSIAVSDAEAERIWAERQEDIGFDRTLDYWGVLHQVVDSFSFGPTLESVPAESATQPVEGDTQPVEGAAQPVEDDAQPVEGAAQPVEGNTQPVEDDAQPVEGATQPVEGTTQSVEGETQPVEGDTQPVEDYIQPAGDAAE